MKKVYEFLATGFEEVEALAPIDIFRRGGIDAKTVSITGNKQVTGAHGVTVTADLTLEEADCSDADLLMLPGGMPGSTNLNDCEPLKALLASQAAAGKRVAAICAAPLVLGGMGLLKGKRATCYPGCEQYMTGADYTRELFTTDGNITTGEGPAATFAYAYELLALLTDQATADQVAEGMMYKHLMATK